jgi:hypothetical protein
MGPTSLLPLRRKSCYGFLSPLKIHRPRPGLNPRTLAPVVSTLTTRPPRAFTLLLKHELSVSIATRLRDRRLGFDFRNGQRFLLSPLRSDRFRGQPRPCPMGISGYSLGVKRSGREADHSPPSNTEVMNAWSYTPLLHTCSRRLHQEQHCLIFKVVT